MHIREALLLLADLRQKKSLGEQKNLKNNLKTINGNHTHDFLNMFWGKNRLRQSIDEFLNVIVHGVLDMFICFIIY